MRCAATAASLSRGGREHACWKPWAVVVGQSASAAGISCEYFSSSAPEHARTHAREMDAACRTSSAGAWAFSAASKQTAKRSISASPALRARTCSLASMCSQGRALNSARCFTHATAGSTYGNLSHRGRSEETRNPVPGPNGAPAACWRALPALVPRLPPLSPVT